MPVDDYRYLPRSIAASFERAVVQRADPIPFTPMRRPAREARVALLTTAGIWNVDTDVSFDYEREQREPWWGDPTFRVLRSDVRQEQIGAGHLHLNNDDLRIDFNIALPIGRMQELAVAGEIGSLAEAHYSFMGFQGGGPNGPDTAAWGARYGPEVGRLMLAEGVDAAVLAPT